MRALRSRLLFTSGPGFSTAQDARVTYDITGLAEDTTYEVVIGVIYNGNTSNPQNLRLARMTTGEPTTGIGTDLDRDGMPNPEDSCPLGVTGAANATADIDNDGCRNSEDPDDDGDGVLDDADAFPLDACASVDADGDDPAGIAWLPIARQPWCWMTMLLLPLLPVSNLTVISTGNNITVSWTNPARDDITGFTIDWVNVGNDTDDGTEGLDSDEATYTIRGLSYAATYTITITVLYENGRSRGFDA